MKRIICWLTGGHVWCFRVEYADGRKGRACGVCDAFKQERAPGTPGKEQGRG